MYEKSNAKGSVDAFDNSINFGFYGLLKYSVSLFFGLASAYWLSNIHPVLSPFSVFVFYFFEVHFLFLFPLLIDHSANPILTSVKLTYKMGLFKTIFIVMQIGVYMIAGVFDVKKPFYKWHIGCLAIIIWYENETRSRI